MDAENEEQCREEQLEAEECVDEEQLEVEECVYEEKLEVEECADEEQLEAEECEDEEQLDETVPIDEEDMQENGGEEEELPEQSNETAEAAQITADYENAQCSEEDGTSPVVVEKQLEEDVDTADNHTKMLGDKKESTEAVAINDEEEFCVVDEVAGDEHVNKEKFPDPKDSQTEGFLASDRRLNIEFDRHAIACTVTIDFLDIEDIYKNELKNAIKKAVHVNLQIKPQLTGKGYIELQYINHKEAHTIADSLKELYKSNLMYTKPTENEWTLPSVASYKPGINPDKTLLLFNVHNDITEQDIIATFPEKAASVFIPHCWRLDTRRRFCYVVFKSAKLADDVKNMGTVTIKDSNQKEHTLHPMPIQVTPDFKGVSEKCAKIAEEKITSKKLVKSRAFYFAQLEKMAYYYAYWADDKEVTDQEKRKKMKQHLEMFSGLLRPIAKDVETTDTGTKEDSRASIDKKTSRDRSRDRKPRLERRRSGDRSRSYRSHSRDRASYRRNDRRDRSPVRRTGHGWAQRQTPMSALQAMSGGLPNMNTMQIQAMQNMQQYAQMAGLAQQFGLQQQRNPTQNWAQMPGFNFNQEQGSSSGSRNFEGSNNSSRNVAGGNNSRNFEASSNSSRNVAVGNNSKNSRRNLEGGNNGSRNFVGSNNSSRDRYSGRNNSSQVNSSQENSEDALANATTLMQGLRKMINKNVGQGMSKDELGALYNQSQTYTGKSSW